MEHECFAPNFINANGSFGRESKSFYAKLSEKIVKKREKYYKVVCLGLGGRSCSKKSIRLFYGFAEAKQFPITKNFIFFRNEYINIQR